MVEDPNDAKDEVQYDYVIGGKHPLCISGNGPHPSMYKSLVQKWNGAWEKCLTAGPEVDL
jgi:hypothetical protein